MHDALDRAVGVVADRVGHLLGPAVELGPIGNELACDRVARIGGIDQLGDVGGQRQRIARGDRFDLGAALARMSPAAIRSCGACAASCVLISWAEVLLAKSWSAKSAALMLRGRPNVNPRSALRGTTRAMQP